MSGLPALFKSLTPEGQEALLNGPTAHAPAGYVSNLENPSNQNALAFAVTTTGLVISGIVALLWAYSKAFCQRKVYLGDVFIIIGIGCFAGYCYCIYYWINLTGMYVHTWDIRMRTMFDFLHIVYVGVNLYGSTLMCLKIGILLEWIRIFVPKGVRSTFWWICTATLWVNALFYISVKISDNVACAPLEALWNLTVEGHCINVKASTFASAIINLISDLIILALPQSVIWRLNLRPGKKAGVAIIFAVGVFCCIAAIFRVITCYQYYISTDAAYDLAPVALWDMVEMTLVIIIACLPSIPAIFHQPRIKSMLASSMSWIGISTKGTGSESRWPASTRNKTTESAGRNAYLEIEEHSLTALAQKQRLDDLESNQSGLDSGGPNSTIRKPQESIKPTPPSGIMRTTQFGAKVDYMQEGEPISQNEEHYRPWDQSRV